MTKSTTTIQTLDELLRQRAIDDDQTPLIAFPKTRTSATDFEPIAGAALDRFVDGAAKSLIQRGLVATAKEIVVGICAPTDLDYIVNIFALIRLGYTVFQLSPRLSPSAIKELLAPLQPPERRILFYAPGYTNLNLDSLHDLQLHEQIQRSEYDDPAHAKTPTFHRDGIKASAEHHRRCLILHSSGSTGLPKPIDYTHSKLMAAGIYAQDATAFITMPFSHALSMMSYMQSIHRRRTIYAMSGYVPQTHDTVTAAIKAANPDIVWTVPYVLKLLAEKIDGIEAIRGCRFVSSGGSKLPDELGDLLTAAGVHVGMQFGSTETGLILSSAYRPREDKAWNYLRPPPHAAPYVTFKPIGTANGKQQYECVVLDGHRTKTISNSSDPPNSWHTSDLFEPHPDIPNAWKFIGRADDRVTLITGEKVLPLPIEGRIAAHPYVRQAVVFGIDREVPGLLLFRAPGPATGLTDTAFLEEVWPSIELANAHAEAFSQITKEMVAAIAEDVECPLTDKSSIKRGFVYREFADVIDAMYEAARMADEKTSSLVLSVPELEDWILRVVGETLDRAINVKTDFFSVGMDSLKAIQLRGLILRNIDLGGRESECGSMIAYDCGNVERLARKLWAIRTGRDFEDDKHGHSSITNRINTYVEKYSTLLSGEIQSRPTGPSSKNASILLTGATGFLGAHLLAALEASANVSTIYALIRRPDSGGAPVTAKERLQDSLRNKGFDSSLRKIVPLYHDLADASFALEQADQYAELSTKVTHVIHCAWPVNFAIPLQAFESQFEGLKNLLTFCAVSPRRPSLLFCSSISVATAADTEIIPSAPILTSKWCAPHGYAQSKLVGERIIERAARSGAVPAAKVLRIGQITPGRRRGTKLWNPSEATPLMIRAASTTSSAGALPVFPGGLSRDRCSWIEADTLADTIFDIAGIAVTSSPAYAAAAEHGTEKEKEGECYEHHQQQLIYNLVNPRPFSWRDDLLPRLRHCRLEFDVVPWPEWLERLENSTRDATVNPSRKLLEFWRRMGVDSDEEDGDGSGGITFDTTAAQAISPALRAAARVVDGSLLEQIVEAWGL
ncbi:putative NRPS-like enzyme [Xylaria arbuscula]|nr:putative NRPS-like enzyme [Xylaria arbuscula]